MTDIVALSPSQPFIFPSRTMQNVTLNIFWAWLASRPDFWEI